MVSVSQERLALANVGLTLRRRDQWRAVHDYSYSRSVTEPATRVFIHITTTEPSNYNSSDAHARGVEAIGRARFGRAQRNTGISYNRLIMPNAVVYEGQPMGRRGAHTVNDKRLLTCNMSGCPGQGGLLSAPSYNLNYNGRSYVICQNVQHSVSNAMIDSLARCIAADKLAGLVARSARIHGHRCVSVKSCPGDRMWARMGELERLVDQYVNAGPVGGGPITEGDDWLDMATQEDLISAVQSGIRQAYEAGAKRTRWGRGFGNAVRDTHWNAGDRALRRRDFVQLLLQAGNRSTPVGRKLSDAQRDALVNAGFANVLTDELMDAMAQAFSSPEVVTAVAEILIPDEEDDV